MTLAYGYTRDGLATYIDQASGATASYAYPDAGARQDSEPVHGVTTVTQTGTDSNKVMPLPGAGTIAMAYDTSGRIASLTKTDANQPTGPLSTWYSYDTLGNLARQTTGAQADAGDREVTDALYDADGIRVLRRTTTHKNGKASTTSTFYLGDTEISLTGVKNAPRTLLRTYTTPGGTPVATEENKGTGTGIAWTWLLADQQHNIRLTRDSTGIKRTNYLPSGAPTGNVNLAPGARGYLNKTHDPSGDIRLDHRNYTPGINILTTPDPLLAPYDPQTLNPYAYAKNNPITLSDPTGLNTADGGSGLTCEDTDTCPKDGGGPLTPVDPPPGAGEDSSCGNALVCDGVLYPNRNYNAANNAYYSDSQGRVIAFADSSYVFKGEMLPLVEGYLHPISGCSSNANGWGCAGAAANLGGWASLLKLGGRGVLRAQFGMTSLQRQIRSLVQVACLRVSNSLRVITGFGYTGMSLITLLTPGGARRRAAIARQ